MFQYQHPEPYLAQSSRSYCFGTSENAGILEMTQASYNVKEL